MGRGDQNNHTTTYKLKLFYQAAGDTVSRAFPCVSAYRSPPDASFSTKPKRFPKDPAHAAPLKKLSRPRQAIPRSECRQKDPKRTHTAPH